jgi:hypothetical protein
MSERTSPSLTQLDALLACLKAQPETAALTQLFVEADALRSAVSAFHLEAIRFRMFSVERLLLTCADQAGCGAAFEDLRSALEAAGFHTRSHPAPPKSAPQPA